MRALDRKLLRDLATLKGQVAAIAVVIAAGVMTLIIAVTTLDALSLTQERFYEDHHFADVFADLKRAPDSLAERLREIPGVNVAETRVQAAVRLEVPDFDDPVRGLLLSIPDGRQPLLNQLYLREGRLPDSGRSDQVAVSDAFAEAHGLRAGDPLHAIIHGRLTTLRVSGIVLSPEFVYQIAPTDLLPDYERYGILWMNRRALAGAYGMDGAFNNVVMTLQAGASEAAVIEQLDRILARYGGIGAHGRDDQPSHRFLHEELRQLRAQAAILPTIFLLVSAFLLNVVMGRIIRSQREQVAVLKAFGYRNRDIAFHYGMLTGLIVLVGCVLGVGLGLWAGTGLAAIYTEYFRFPELRFRLQGWVLLLAVAVAFGAALLGTLRSVWRAVSLPPAEAMRPEPPARFRKGWIERAVPDRWLDQGARIVLRNIGRHPVKAGLSVLGIAMSVGLLVMGAYQLNAVDHMLDTQYRLVLRMDVHLTFTDPTPARVHGELRHQPGVLAVETYRSVPVRLLAGHRDYRTAILGLDEEPQLRQLLDGRQRPQRLPPEGLLLTDYLADDLGLQVGDPVRVEIQEGHRRTVSVPLTGVVDEPLGVSAYMRRDAVNRLMREGPAVSGAWLLVDPARETELFDSLWEIPGVAAIGQISQAERNIREYMGDTILMFALVFVLLAGSIAFAVVYNNARIAFAERARELATLQVLGYSRAEVSAILVGEILALTVVALPVGWLIGTGFAWALNQAFSMDMFRVPLVLTPAAYGFATAAVLAASAVAAVFVVRRLHRLDKVSVLKAVE
ncbi:ABC-type antimicrobial peptide transport system, permease component [Thioalkalivibrio nitratireducens DSM 14787]|uniref:ABC-type antimicrobial peptide transport system, permease component n=1 Tax=Thioalkalivibrio nitratireducens (strain DSM 14787 / UNIQEM 213 / ALEN2) TaxID=1255043 RepID=L0DZR1_THIND|nr:ABC transporter permease [Thioalkalivibrio nitratireducens]AGA34435.1 ABC-type antimicrobial peptide transport system, permease component [Thioalkalivibrio nitratireducens DSM 14787]